jgi:hypothetical protein
VDQLIERLARLREQKQEIERQEQLVIQQLRERLNRQRERLQKLGVSADAPLNLTQPIVPTTPAGPAPQQ